MTGLEVKILIIAGAVSGVVMIMIFAGVWIVAKIQRQSSIDQATYDFYWRVRRRRAKR